IHVLRHILGYEHMVPDDKAEMRKEEEFILQRLGYVREGEEL
ncbi:rRNA maturation RNAse YbeY, partial [Megasphaera sp.]